MNGRTFLKTHYAERKITKKKGVANMRPPLGARVRIVCVRVKQDGGWQEAIDSSCPETPGDYWVRKVANQHSPIGKGEVNKKLILLNFPNNDGDLNKAKIWAEEYGLKKTNPREVFAVGERHPDLNKSLGRDDVFVVATTECNFRGQRVACCVSWFRGVRTAELRRIKYFDHSCDWFAFRK